MILTETYKKRLKELAGIRSKEMEDIDEKDTLDVYDFDGTLVDTPLPEEGKLIWKEKTGEEWSGGWFSEPNSLNLDVFDMPTISSVVSEYRKSASNPKSLKVMLTGRIEPLEKYVISVLNHHGLKFDDYLFNDGGETGDNKMAHVEKILKYNPNIRHLNMWDDRVIHIPIFKKWGDELVDKGYLETFTLNQVKNGSIIKV